MVGMAALFSSASGAVFASAVFALETTRQWQAAVPLLASCALAFLIAKSLTDTTIMTEKIYRRGVQVPDEYRSDPLSQLKVEDVYSDSLFSIQADMLVGEAKDLVSCKPCSVRHHLPIVEAEGRLIGVLTRAEILEANSDGLAKVRDLVLRGSVTTTLRSNLRDAANQMILKRVGCLPVVDENLRLLGIVTRSDLLEAEKYQLDEEII